MFQLTKKSTSKIETIIGPGTEMEGNLRTAESIRIDGKIKGEVSAESVILGASGVVLGDISANRVVVAGRVKGNVSATASLELLPKGQLLGDIRTNKLVISDGATFEGNCQMLKSDGQILELNPQILSPDAEDGDHHKGLKVVNGNGKR